MQAYNYDTNYFSILKIKKEGCNTNIFIETNTTKANALELEAKLIHFIKDCGHRIADSVDQADIILSLGGDGTLINTWHKYYGLNLPIFGINCGHLGYLTEGTPANYQSKLRQIFNNQAYIENRLCLQGRVFNRSSLTSWASAAVNEFVIREIDGKMIDYSIIVDQQEIQRAKGDGIICATPTGSTAYALSAGGAFIDPTISAVELIGICPHSLMNRSIILPTDRAIGIQIHTPGIVTVDGRNTIHLDAEQTFNVERCETSLHLLRLDRGSFIEKIAENFCKI